MTRHRRACVASIGALIAWAGSCTVGDLPDDTGKAGTSGDSGTEAQSGSGGTGGDDVSDASDGEASTDCPEIYVSSSGDDANTGCDKSKPKHTIANALESAHAASSIGAIRICAGTYDEALVLDVAVDLAGGYDCSSWTRTSGFGFPSFDGTNESVVGGTQSGEALRITGATVDSSSLIDGLTFRGGTSSVAVRIESAAAPALSNCRILGGTPTSTSITGHGAVGLSVETGAKPEISENHIEGGTGSSLSVDAYARAAIVIDASAPSVHDNDILGGSGSPIATSGSGSVGILVTSDLALTEASGNPIARNQIHGGDGYAPDGVASSGALMGSVGVSLRGAADVDLVQNAIFPGHTIGGSYRLAGIDSHTTGALRVVQSRVYGGDLSSLADPSLGGRTGISVNGAKSFIAENDMVYGGVAGDPSKLPATINSFSRAISLSSVKNPNIRHSTLYSGPSDFNAVGTALWIDVGVSGAVIQDNLLSADAHWNEPITSLRCASLGVLERLENNLFFNASHEVNDALPWVMGYWEDPQGTCGAWQAFETIDDLTSHLVASGATAQGNLTLRASCGSDSACIAWPGCDASPANSLSCLKSVFAEWSQADNGLTTLLGPGWKLAPAIPCAIAKSSLDLGVGVDLLGNARTGAPSMGAAETETCAP